MEEIISLCEKGHFTSALELIDKRIRQTSPPADLYRLKGQVLLEFGEIDEAIDSLIQALTIDPKNESALILIGNIYALHKADVDTSLVYFKQVLDLNTDNYFTLSNIGSVLAKSQQFDEAKGFFEKSLIVHPDFENAILGLGIIYFEQEQFLKSFNQASHGLKILAKKKSPDSSVYQNLSNLMQASAKQYVSKVNEEELYIGLLNNLREKSGLPIVIKEDATLSTWAKLKVAEYHNLSEHQIIINTIRPGYAYFVLHELMHLAMILDAREENENELFTSTDATYITFKKKFAKDIRYKKLQKTLNEKAEVLIRKLYDGLCLQIYNAPLDLLIEESINRDFEEVRPLQYLGLFSMHQEAIKGAKDTGITSNIPTFVRDASITLMATQLIQFKELFGIDFLNEIKEKRIVKKAFSLYNQFQEIKDDKAPGEEYDLVRWWAEDLALSKYFILKKEVSIEDQVSSIESDPFGLYSSNEEEEAAMQKFIANRDASGLNLAVVFHMKSAFNYFRKIGDRKIKEIGTEIALLGRTGIDPYSEETYSLSSSPGIDFSGWKLLAWMYCAWMHIDPNIAKEMQLSFEEEYKMAQAM